MSRMSLESMSRVSLKAEADRLIDEIKCDKIHLEFADMILHEENEAIKKEEALYLFHTKAARGFQRMTIDGKYGHHAYNEDARQIVHTANSHEYFAKQYKASFEFRRSNARRLRCEQSIRMSQNIEKTEHLKAVLAKHEEQERIYQGANGISFV